MILWKKPTAIPDEPSIPASNAVTVVTQSPCIDAVKKAKKRKRDKTAGLLLPSSVAPTPSIHVPKPPKMAAIAQPAIKKPINQPQNTKQDPKKKPMIRMVAPPLANQHQKKNNLLNLANALKMKTNTANQNNDKNKLEKLLR